MNIQESMLCVLYHRFYCDANSNTLRMLYTTSVRLLLEYAVPVWDPHLVKNFEAVGSKYQNQTQLDPSWDKSLLKTQI